MKLPDLLKNEKVPARDSGPLDSTTNQIKGWSKMKGLVNLQATLGAEPAAIC